MNMRHAVQHGRFVPIKTIFAAKYIVPLSNSTRSISKLSAINQGLRNASNDKLDRPVKSYKPHKPDRSNRASRPVESVASRYNRSASNDAEHIKPRSGHRAEDPFAKERLSRRNRSWSENGSARRSAQNGPQSSRFFLESQNLPNAGPPAPLSRAERNEATQRRTNAKVLGRERWHLKESKNARKFDRPRRRYPYEPLPDEVAEQLERRNCGPNQHDSITNDNQQTAEAQKSNGRAANHLSKTRSNRTSTPEPYVTDSYVYDAEPVVLSSAASTYIFGHRLVSAALQSKRRKCYRVGLVPHVSADKEAHFRILTESMSIPLTEVDHHFIENVIRNSSTNFQIGDPFVADGVLAEVSPLPQPPLLSLGQWNQTEGTFSLALDHQSGEDKAINGTATVARYNESDWRAPLLLWLHGVVDIRNVGAIFRTALFMGVDGIILSSRETAGLNSGVLKSSTGATEWLPAYKAPADLNSFISTSQDNGWKFYGAVAPFAKNPESSSTTLRPTRDALFANDLSRSPAISDPCVLVLGNEDEGLEPRLVKQFDQKITIPGSLAGIQAGIDSLNVGTAAALLIDRFLRKPSSEKMASLDEKAIAAGSWD